MYYSMLVVYMHIHVYILFNPPESKSFPEDHDICRCIVLICSNSVYSWFLSKYSVYMYFNIAINKNLQHMLHVLYTQFLWTLHCKTETCKYLNLLFFLVCIVIYYCWVVVSNVSLTVCASLMELKLKSRSQINICIWLTFEEERPY